MEVGGRASHGGVKIYGGDRRTMRDIIGQKFGLLTIIELQEVKRYKSERNTQTKAYYRVLCDCGISKVVRGEHLSQGKIVSCGCYGRTASAKANTKHGMTGSPEYRSWLSMRTRVLNPDNLHAKYYKDVHIHESWLKDFMAFYRDMGPKPSPEYEIDRIDPFGNYEPGNCRWATRSQQMRNTRRNFLRHQVGAVA